MNMILRKNRGLCLATITNRVGVRSLLIWGLTLAQAFPLKIFGGSCVDLGHSVPSVKIQQIRTEDSRYFYVGVQDQVIAVLYERSFDSRTPQSYSDRHLKSEDADRYYQGYNDLGWSEPIVLGILGGNSQFVVLARATNKLLLDSDKILPSLRSLEIVIIDRTSPKNPQYHVHRDLTRLSGWSAGLSVHYNYIPSASSKPQGPAPLPKHQISIRTAYETEPYILSFAEGFLNRSLNPSMR